MNFEPQETTRRTLLWQHDGIHVVLEECADGGWEFRVQRKTHPHKTSHQVVGQLRTETEARRICEAILTILNEKTPEENDG